LPAIAEYGLINPWREIMSSATNKVVEEALSLPSDERASLVEKLISSLNLPVQEEIDQLWADEAERRVSQIEKGEIELIPGNEVFAKIRRKYRK
jgi:putative addiction module component (TIGR02574 family)